MLKVKNWVGLVSAPILLASVGCAINHRPYSMTHRGLPPEHMMALAQTLERQGHYSQAKIAYSQVLAVQPMYPNAQQSLNTLIAKEAHTAPIRGDQPTTASNMLIVQSPIGNSDGTRLVSADHQSPNPGSVNPALFLPPTRIPQTGIPAPAEPALRKPPIVPVYQLQPLRVPPSVSGQRETYSAPKLVESSAGNRNPVMASAKESSSASKIQAVEFHSIPSSVPPALLPPPAHFAEAPAVRHSNGSSLDNEHVTDVALIGEPENLPEPSPAHSKVEERREATSEELPASIAEHKADQPASLDCRSQAAFLVESIGSEAADDSSALRQPTRYDRDVYLRVDLSEAIVETQPKADDAISVLVECLKGSDKKLKCIAVVALREAVSQQNTLVIDNLKELLHTEDPRLTRMVLLTLAEFGPAAAKALPEVENALESSDSATRVVARAAMACIAPDGHQAAKTQRDSR